MDYIYNSYEDRYAGCAVVYTTPVPSEHFVYVDKDCTEKIDGSTLKDLFYKGLIIEEIGTDSCKPCTLTWFSTPNGGIGYQVSYHNSTGQHVFRSSKEFEQQL